MTELNLDNVKIKLYDSIKEMPISLHNMAQSYLMQESGIGSDMSSFDAHFSSLDALLAAERINDAINEKTNLRLNFYTMLHKVDFNSLAFSCYIHSVDGVKIPLEERNEDDMKVLLELLSNEGLTRQMVEDQLEDLKKNFTPN